MPAAAVVNQAGEAGFGALLGVDVEGGGERGRDGGGEVEGRLTGNTPRSSETEEAASPMGSSVSSPPDLRCVVGRKHEVRVVCWNYTSVSGFWGGNWGLTP